MTRVWFAGPLETVATYWRIQRKDGVTLGFTSHDRDVWLDGVLHRASPGMAPSSVRRNAGLEEDSLSVSGALTHETIAPADLAAGRFDGAHVRVGLVDWESGEHAALFVGTIGSVGQEDGRFTATLASRKAALLRQAVPRTSPVCRAAFCGPGCNLNPQAFTTEAVLTSVDPERDACGFAGIAPADRFVGGTLVWLEGAGAGLRRVIVDVTPEGLLIPGEPEPSALLPGARARLRQGCDHTLATCAERFGNAVNFRGEPFLPGNDMLARYPDPA